MKLDLNKIISIKDKSDLKSYKLNKPIFYNSYLFHYLILLRNLTGLKLTKFPIYIENGDNMNGFHIAAKEDNMEILCYLIDNYPEYIYNINKNDENFIYYIPFERIPYLIKLYPSLDWHELIENKNILESILINLSYNSLLKFITLYQPDSINMILRNNNMNSSKKIKLLSMNKNINSKNISNEGIIFDAIFSRDIDIVKFLIEKKVDIDYNSYGGLSPLFYSLKLDYNDNNYNISILLIKNITDIYNINNQYYDNILHRLLYKSPLSSKLLFVLKNANYKVWNQMNINLVSPLELIMQYDYEKYHIIFTDMKDMQINSSILNNIKDKETSWYILFSKFKVYKEDSIIIEEEKYVHATIFQSKFKDMAFYALYIQDKYQVYLPNIESYLLSDVTFENLFPFERVDDILSKKLIFPWCILFYKDTGYIHPYLNNLINATRYERKYRFAFVVLSIIYNETLHANIIIYDFIMNTIERFEPYGRFDDNIMDDYLEEELTWNTGMLYIRPSEYLKNIGFQIVSDENNMNNMKPGDIGGFCAAWCFWYLENRLKNPDIKSKDLVSKLINYLIQRKSVDYIRNYANKLGNVRFKYMKEIGISKDEITNTFINTSNDKKIEQYLVSTFTKGIFEKPLKKLR
jgi:hypothetical protein